MAGPERQERGKATSTLLGSVYTNGKLFGGR